ncbi:hypothetical protein [Pseudanabaena sp. ABRG5-3]|uniref:hypothetical protein n=1 Tax=Pseudanabaena sp. ABRG5-3 TaxID=685565 RepID=UPI0013A66251|nr:hypothetical protein [Pseudanabaena sp. ABRG5-3]
MKKIRRQSQFSMLDAREIPLGESLPLVGYDLTSVQVKLANFKSPKVKALLRKAFTLGL